MNIKLNGSPIKKEWVVQYGGCAIEKRNKYEDLKICAGIVSEKLLLTGTGLRIAADQSSANRKRGRKGYN